MRLIVGVVVQRPAIGEPELCNAATISSMDAYGATCRINANAPGDRPPPVILLASHHEPAQVWEYYRAADVCFVSSLHDGMNLVAKEFVASREDERGVLLLSQFTGAARELPEALVVNPYDTDQCARALHFALSMPEGEQRARMRLMRGLVQSHNVYRWTGRMLLDAAGMRSHHRLRRRSSVPVEVWRDGARGPGTGE